MRTLQLIIKDKYLAEIVAGIKQIETRDLHPRSSKRYIDDSGEELKIHQYDTITFFGGYNKNRKSGVVEVKGAEVFLITDDDGNNIPFEYEGKEYLEAVIEYSLGKVLSHNFTL